MLIRQKAGWRLHHQAYLWPRQSRPSKLSSITTSLLLPQRRRRSVLAGEGTTSPLLRRRSSSSGSCMEGEDILPMSSLSRTDSCEAVDTSSPSSVSSSAATSPCKRTTSSSLELDIDDLFPLNPARLTAEHTSRASSVTSDFISDEIIIQESGRESSKTGDELTDEPLLEKPIDVCDTESEAVCQTRCESSSVRKRRDTRSADFRSNSAINNNLSSSLKGSTNNNLALCGSNYTPSTNIRESLHRNSANCPRTSRMGVLCAEQHNMEVRCECDGKSPRPASVHSLFPFSYESNNEDVVKRIVSRKRSVDTSIYDTDRLGTAVVRRRAIRSPSAGSINGHTSVPSKLGAHISAALGHNGLKRESSLNGISIVHGYQNGTRPFCCLGLPSMAHHHPVTVTSPLTSSQLEISCQNGNSTSVFSSHNSGSVSRPSQSSVLSVGSTAQPAPDDTNHSRRPQPPSSLLQLTSSLSCVASPHNYIQAQGSLSSNIGSSNSSISSSSSSSDYLETDNVSITKAFPSRCTSPNSTVLSLRQRRLSGNKSLSQPASPQSSTSSFSKSKCLLSSSSLPSLSTLMTETSSLPATPTVVQCRWRACSSELDASDLLEHIRKHVESQIEKKTYACLWTDCKVFNKPSWSDSWLERHIVSHSGHRPFKCILDNCGQRFHSQVALERHVNGHFTANSQNGAAKSGRTREEITHRMLQKRKRQLKRTFVQTVKRNDFFDDHTMAGIKHDLVTLAHQTELDLTGNALCTTFHGLLIGRRCTKTGCKQALIEFTPSDVLEDKWTLEEDVHQLSKISVQLSGLPNDTIANLHDSFYRAHRFRKHRRK